MDQANKHLASIENLLEPMSAAKLDNFTMVSRVQLDQRLVPFVHHCPPQFIHVYTAGIPKPTKNGFILIHLIFKGNSIKWHLYTLGSLCTMTPWFVGGKPSPTRQGQLSVENLLDGGVRIFYVTLLSCEFNLLRASFHTQTYFLATFAAEPLFFHTQ